MERNKHLLIFYYLWKKQQTAKAKKGAGFDSCIKNNTEREFEILEKDPSIFVHELFFKYFRVTPT